MALAPGQLQGGGAGPPEEPSDALPARVERGEAPRGVLGARSLWSLLPAQTPTFTIWERQTLSVSFPGMLQHVARDKEHRGGSHCGLGDCQEALGTVRKRWGQSTLGTSQRWALGSSGSPLPL